MPDGMVEKAYVRLEHQDRSLISGVLQVTRASSAASCEARFEKILVKGSNPLVPDVHPEGTWIPSGEITRFSVLWLHDFAACGSPVAFVPMKDHHYVIGTNLFKKDGVSYCSARVMDTGPDGRSVPQQARLSPDPCSAGAASASP
ncbi:hypothetical protein [Piscinibacter gummiphilus]|uniref:Uncharacterized protein n=1 Tax=Piscinibacter gummiphilus TaxID=946333 RepID=A0A1W6L7C5_9BURK|nr:hypothetical protein [Piscinibacter gummiphilus]ARN20195.1 hypothetical protein A4W93_09930 [Piscinibacter gummiphilus]ATU64865.1 hypothetical protein CPZ87_10010 [Piscinibacter gummiphilus]GLS96510.1 hypothetical protein GCM10007918_38020 [Piscinibacter gummiphilus]